MKFLPSALLLALLPQGSAFAPQPLGARADTGLALAEDAYGRALQATAAPAAAAPGGEIQSIQSIWENLAPVLVQGSSLRTWSFQSGNVERVQVLLKTDGRPLNSNIDLWQGPDNTPHKIGVYIEDGDLRPFCAIIETPGTQNAIAIRNTGQLEFPMSACVETKVPPPVTKKAPEVIQGGALKTYAFKPSVESVQVVLATDGRPLNARLELLQGPNNNKQVVEIYTEDGVERPFHIILQTPGVGNVVRCMNTSPIEFPMQACIEPYTETDYSADDDFIVISGGSEGTDVKKLR